MENNQWDNQLRDLLGEYKPGGAASPWGDPASSMDQPADLHEESTSGTDPARQNDQELQSRGWKRIEASLDEADHAFDETIKHKLSHYSPQYDPHSWPVLLKRLTDSRFLRAKLIVLKSIEVAALLLLLLTLVNVGRLGDLNFSPGTEQTWPAVKPQNPSSKNSATSPATQPEDQNNRRAKDLYATAEKKHPRGDLAQTKPDFAAKSDDVSFVEPQYTESSYPTARKNTPAGFISGTANLPVLNVHEIPVPVADRSVPFPHSAYQPVITEPIDAMASLVRYESATAIPAPTYSKPIHRTYTEFAILAQSDYNGLRMPEDRLYTAGRQIVFPQQGIMSQGYGAGFTIAIGHPLWALETGVIYSAKHFKPGRQLIVGGAFDNGSVEFEAMRLQLVSLPVQYRYRFDHHGRFKLYGLAGLGFHVIAQSDIDVLIKYHFASLSFGENPNNDPDLAETIAETRRISEHIRDGAPFSTKSFVSVNGGIGAEYELTMDKTLFLQTAIQYQIPDLKFSNNNGKHLRSVSLQAGVRTPLGK